MPAMHFIVRWPDGSREHCYSPSTVIEKHLETGKVYTVAEFTQTATAALDEASQRVEAKFGFFCSSAMDQSAAIQAKATQYATNDSVVVESITVRVDPDSQE